MDDIRRTSVEPIVNSEDDARQQIDALRETLLRLGMIDPETMDDVRSDREADFTVDNPLDEGLAPMIRSVVQPDR